jgi:hypothetical protein
VAAQAGTLARGVLGFLFEGRRVGLVGNLGLHHRGDVVVEADGFRWEGKVFASLSAVATELSDKREPVSVCAGMSEFRLRRVAAILRERRCD